ATQPDAALRIELGSQWLRFGMVRMGQQPLLHIRCMAGLELLPLTARCCLDPKRAESGGDGLIDKIGQVRRVVSRYARPHVGQLLWPRPVLTECGAEQQPPAGIYQTMQYAKGLADTSESLVRAEVDHNIRAGEMTCRRSLDKRDSI